VYKPENVEQIEYDILEECFRCNSDGAGYSYWDEKEKIWNIIKGFMDFDDFWKSFEANEFTKESIWMAHFRIATSGNTDGGNTHPFVVCDNFNTMRKKLNKAEDIAYHNGVVGKGSKVASDTMEHIKECILPMHLLIEEPEYKKCMELVCEQSSNRWLITKGKDIYTYGNWEEDKGIFYSNTSYRIPVYNKKAKNAIVKVTKNNCSVLNDDTGIGKWPYNIYDKRNWEERNKEWADRRKKRKEIAAKANKKIEDDKKKDELYNKYIKDGKAKTVKEAKDLYKPSCCPGCKKKNAISYTYWYLGKREHVCHHCGAVFNDDLEIKFFEMS